jgi:D-alanyl-D-alanine dipeptidase
VDLVELGYIAEKSGHSRGGSVDLTIVRRNEEGEWVELDMGSPWDLFDAKSHAGSTLVGETARANRILLANIMIKHGFKPYSEEWWHFTLVDEPYPDTYFDFPIK